MDGSLIQKEKRILDAIKLTERIRKMPLNKGCDVNVRINMLNTCVDQVYELISRFGEESEHEINPSFVYPYAEKEELERIPTTKDIIDAINPISKLPLFIGLVSALGYNFYSNCPNCGLINGVDVKKDLMAFGIGVAGVLGVKLITQGAKLIRTNLESRNRFVHARECLELVIDDTIGSLGVIIENQSNKLANKIQANFGENSSEELIRPILTEANNDPIRVYCRAKGVLGLDKSLLYDCSTPILRKIRERVDDVENLLGLKPILPSQL